METNLVSCGAVPTRITARMRDCRVLLCQPEEVIVITERTYAYNTDLREAPASPGTQGTEDHHSTVGQAGRLKWRENMMAGLLHGRAKMSDHRLREECTDCSCSGRCIWPGQAREPKDHETDWSSYNTGRTPATLGAGRG